MHPNATGLPCWVRYGTADDAKALIGKRYHYALSPEHVLLVEVREAVSASGVLFAFVNVLKVVKRWKGKDMTNYKRLEKESIYAGKLTNI